MRSTFALTVLLVVSSALNTGGETAQAETVLFDFGNDSSYRGASVTNPDSNGNYWNSIWAGDFYPNVLDTSGGTTAIDFGFSSATGTDYYNGPSGAIPDSTSTVYNATSLGNLGVDKAVYDYYVSSKFEIQQLDPNSKYNLTFYGSHKYNDDNTTRYTVYTDNTFTTPVASTDLIVGSGANHNQSNVVSLSGLSPQANNSLYIGFTGVAGGNGYLNALQLDNGSAPDPDPSPNDGPLKVYMHYMPWFETPDTLGGNQWGYHWKFQNKDPNVIGADGRRQIASHYYPKIGPYASRDTDVIEYHMLLMKYAGVDGVLVDWYGVQGTNGDIGDLLASSNAIVDQVDDFEMEFGVVLEDRFSANVNQAKANLAYLRDNYFNKPEYIRHGAGDDPLMMVFGPISFQEEAEWTQILAEAGEDVEFLTLWYESGDAGSNADGEFSWVYEDESQDNFASHLQNFYANRAPNLGVAAGSAFPGFNDYYVEGGVGNVVPFNIPHDNGQTLATTLALADQNRDNIDILQLATFNDFGEGTIFEPTVETGFDYLRQIQEFTDSPFGLEELELIFRLYRVRKDFEGNAVVQAKLDQVSEYLAALDVDAARLLLDTVHLPGDFDENGTVDGIDFVLWQRQFGLTGLYPLATQAADGNADGIVDAADLALWRQYYGASILAEPLSKNEAVPEPSTIALLLPLLCRSFRLWPHLK